MSEQRATGVPSFELRHRLARALEQGTVSTEQMADEIGRGVTTIRNYLKGRTVPERAVLVTWALRCGVPFDWLAYGIESEPNTPEGQDISPSTWNGGQVIDFRARPLAPSRLAA